MQEAFCEKFITEGIIVSRILTVELVGLCIQILTQNELNVGQTLYGIQTVMAIMLTFIMGFGWSFCIRHPSRTFKSVGKQYISPAEIPAESCANDHNAVEDYLRERERGAAMVAPPIEDQYSSEDVTNGKSAQSRYRK